MDTYATAYNLTTARANRGHHFPNDKPGRRTTTFTRFGAVSQKYDTFRSPFLLYCLLRRIDDVTVLHALIERSIQKTPGSLIKRTIRHCPICTGVAVTRGIFISGLPDLKGHIESEFGAIDSQAPLAIIRLILDQNEIPIFRQRTCPLVKVDAVAKITQKGQGRTSVRKETKRLDEFAE